VGKVGVGVSLGMVEVCVVATIVVVTMVGGVGVSVVGEVWVRRSWR
jgi:hypothetical protein